MANSVNPDQTAPIGVSQCIQTNNDMQNHIAVFQHVVTTFWPVCITPHSISNNSTNSTVALIRNTKNRL